jgi:ABC-2 type transport system permease protein
MNQYLKTLFILSKKELMSYFNSPIAYIFIALFLVVGNWLFFNQFFIAGQASLRSYFSFLPWMFLLLVPSLSMRQWAEEKKSGTVELLLTLPITNWQAVLAKFLSSLVFIILTLVLSLTIPFSISSIGEIDRGPVLGGYIGAIFLAGSYLALGQFISSLTKNQIIAFVTSLAACFFFFIIGANFVVLSSPKIITPILYNISLDNHFTNIAKGVLNSRDLIYYFSFIFFFLWLTVKVIESRKWR